MNRGEECRPDAEGRDALAGGGQGERHSLLPGAGGVALRNASAPPDSVHERRKAG